MCVSVYIDMILVNSEYADDGMHYQCSHLFKLFFYKDRLCMKSESSLVHWKNEFNLNFLMRTFSKEVWMRNFRVTNF